MILMRGDMHSVSRRTLISLASGLIPMWIRKSNSPFSEGRGRRLNALEFGALMQTVAEGWNRGDAKLAASCFAENAIYSSPPSLHTLAARTYTYGSEGHMGESCR